MPCTTVDKSDEDQRQDEAGLRREIAVNSRREDFCARTVVLALVFEAIVLLQYSGNKPLLETALLIACNLMIAVAIYGEIGFGGRRSTAQSDLQRLSDERVAVSLAEAEEAKARAAEANRRAEEARLELARFRAPRELSPEQIDRIGEKVRSFAGMQYDVDVTSFNNPEIIGLVDCIEMTLEKAGWVQLSWRGQGTILPRQAGRRLVGTNASALNVVVGVTISRPEVPALMQAGMALANALELEGIAATPATLPVEGFSANENTIHVLIGRKM